MGGERVAAIIIGLIFVTSIAGYALMGVRTPQNNDPGIQIPNIIYRELQPEEKIYVLQTGRVLIEDFYSSMCMECIDDRMILESFAQQFPDHTVLEVVSLNSTETNETGYVKLQMIGSGGSIIKINESGISENNLMVSFCEIAIIQPRECLLLEI